MIYTSLSDVPPCAERAVIINCGTKELSTLALLSTIRYAGMPVLLIDCESADGSLEHFRDLAQRVSFDLVSAPLRPHGLTLDRIFTELYADQVLLVDSDVEVLDERLLTMFREFADDASTFGFGFVNGPGRIRDHAGDFLDGAFLQERMWVPFTLLKTSHVRRALAAGHSFEAHTVYNDASRVSRLVKGLAWAVHVRITARTLERLVPRFLRRTFYGQRPAVVVWDTGAEIYQHLRYDLELNFVGLPEVFHPRYVTHFFGSTRNTLDDSNVHAGERHDHNLRIVRARLREVYATEV